MQHSAVLCAKMVIYWSFGNEAVETSRLSIRLESLRI